jgi:DNA-binding NarL/FixJ family response regulator
MIRVCLVDDQTLVRQGIRSLLALDGGIEVVAEAADGRQAVEMIPVQRPDVVLMDMRMPVMSGLEALQMLAANGALPPTIILTTFDDDQLVLAGLKAGPRGICSRMSRWSSWSARSALWLRVVRWCSRQ